MNIKINASIIKKRMKELELSSEKLAVLMGVSYSTVQRILGGKIPHGPTLFVLLKVLDLDGSEANHQSKGV